IATARRSTCRTSAAPLAGRTGSVTDNQSLTRRGMSGRRKAPVSHLKSVLVEHAAFHDGGKMRALVLEEPEVLERIAVDDDEIGERAGLDHAELTFAPHDLCA